MSQTGWVRDQAPPIQSGWVPDQTTAPQQPGLLARTSQAALGTQHPWDQVKSEWDQLTTDPVGTLEKAAKTAAMVPVNLAYQATHHPFDTAESILPVNRAIGDVKSGNYRGAAGDVLGGALNVAGMVKGQKWVAGPEADATSAATLKAPEDAAAAASDFQKAIPATKSTPYTVEQYARARPYLEAEHQASPIGVDSGVENTRDAADSAIGKIEDKVSQAIQANPTDQITSKPLNDVIAALSQNQRGPAFVKAGLNEIQDFNLNQPKTVAQADAIRRQLNLENKAALKKNNYDQAAAMASDPAFVARATAADSLREGIRDKLEQRGIPGVQDLRQDEGALIAIRNAAQNQLFNGDKTVASTGIATTGQTIKANLTRAAATGGGAAIGGAVAGAPGAAGGAIIGAGAGELASRFFKPDALTRNELVARSFTKQVAGSPEYLKTPTAPQIRGLLRGAVGEPIEAGAAPLTGDTSGPINLGAPFIDPRTRAERLGLLLPESNGSTNYRVGGQAPGGPTQNSAPTAIHIGESVTPGGQLARTHGPSIPLGTATPMPRILSNQPGNFLPRADQVASMRSMLQGVIDSPNSTQMQKTLAKHQMGKLNTIPLKQLMGGSQ